MSKVQERAVKPRFAVGSCVRIKTGVMDPDFPGMHLAGWKGTISQVERGKMPHYLVQWTPATLDGLSPACRDFCEFEDVAFEEMWLLEKDLGPDPTAPLAPKRPAGVAAAPVSC